MTVKALMPVRIVNLVAPLAHEATDMHATDTAAPAQARSGAIALIAARAYSTRAEGQFNAPKAWKSRFCTLQMPLLSVSATDIRSRIASRQGVVPLVGEPVARYIDQHHLYQTA